jgi:O-antigen/teichoic acid export membrane protein
MSRGGRPGGDDDPVVTERSNPSENDLIETPISMAEVKRRVAAGAVLFALRDSGLQVVSLLTQVLLARLLDPRDFGIVAIGFTLISVGRMITDAGVGESLVRREEKPTRRELQAMTGLQLLLTSVLAVGALGVSLTIGGAAPVTAVMMLSLPILSLRTPGILLLERTLDYRVRFRVEIAEALTYAVWVSVAALLGFGVWSIATAILAQGIVGAGAVIIFGPLGWMRPRLDLHSIRPLLSYGLQYQSLSVFQMIHDVLLTSGVAAVGGIAALGIWSFANRLLSVPMYLFGLLWQLGIPAYARMSQGDADLGAEVARSTTVLGVVAGLPLALVGGCSSALIPLLFGAQWTDADLILPGACVALSFAGPLNTCIAGALLGAGDARTPLYGAIVHFPFRLGISLIGLHYFGLSALGIGWVIAQAAELPIMLPRAHRFLKHPVGRQLMVPAVATTIAGASGLLSIGLLFGHHILGLVAGSALTTATFFLVLALIGRDTLGLTLVTGRRVLQAARRRRTRPAPGTLIADG